MKVSIVIPLYNCAEYISTCLDSVANQDFKGEIECIVVDDCGQDDSVIVANQWLDGYNGSVVFHIIHHAKNKGASAARNTGLKQCTGDYVMYVDGDDWITSDCVSLLQQLFEKYPDIDMAQAGMKTTDGSIPWFDFEKNPFPEYTNDYYDIKTRLLGAEVIPASPVNKLFKRSFLIDNGLLFYEGIVIEDVLWCFMLAKHVKALAIENRNTYIYNIHPGSVVTSGKGIDPARFLKIYDLMIDKIDEPYKEEQINHIIYLIDRIYFQNENREIRKKAGILLFKLSKQCSFKECMKLQLKGFLSFLDNGNKSIPYYLYYKLS